MNAFVFQRNGYLDPVLMERWLAGEEKRQLANIFMHPYPASILIRRVRIDEYGSSHLRSLYRSDSNVVIPPGDYIVYGQAVLGLSPPPSPGLVALSHVRRFRVGNCVMPASLRANGKFILIPIKS